MEGETITEARFALGGVAHKPWRDPSAEALLHGRAATEANFEKAADMLLRDAKGCGHNDFKIPTRPQSDRARIDPGGAGTPQPVADKKIR